MKFRSPLALVLGTLVLTVLACNLPAFSRQVGQPAFESSVAGTVTAELRMRTTEPVPDSPEPAAARPTETPPPTETPTITPTPTPSIPIVGVIQNTNCRTGPGTVYDLLYVFMVGDEAEILARSSIPEYVIIEVPDGSGRECWLWMRYGEQEGSTDALPQRTPPPTPTPAPTATPELNFTLTLSDFGPCGAKEALFLRIANTGTLKLESHQVSAVNQDTAETDDHQSDHFAGDSQCPAIGVPAVDPGDAWYVIARFTPPIGGTRVDVMVKACTGDGLAGSCRSKSITVDVPSMSDVERKEAFEPVDGREILDLLETLPITSWTYIDRAGEGRHIGPIAQDFNELFGVGEYEGYISSVDSYGVALAAVQALSEINEGQADRIEHLEAQNAALADRIVELDARIDALGVVLSAVLGVGAVLMLARRVRGSRHPRE